LYVDVRRIDIGLRWEVFEQVKICLGTWNIGELDLLSLSSLRVTIFQLFKNVKKPVIGRLHELKETTPCLLAKGVDIAQPRINILLQFINLIHILLS
jgi:hypothetical protein